jgi:DNA-binding winged helix-turn-helix (wHTH) protein/tetratricopeptide (TPR) repeat protein
VSGGGARSPGARRAGDGERTGWAFAQYSLDFANELLRRGSEPIALKPKAFAVLRYLVERPRCLVTKQELLSALWPDVHVGDAALKTQLKEIRSALQDDARAPMFIETAHRRGYRFIAAVEPILATPPSPVRAAQSALVGRAKELAQLDATLARARSGALHTVFITGEAGAGKTALADHFLARLAQGEDVWVAHGQCIEQYGVAEAYMPVLEAFARLARGSHAEAVIAVLRRNAPTWLAQLSGLLDESDAAQLRRTGAATSERMLREIADAIASLSQQRPMVVLIEDVQWADYSTLNLISYLGRRLDRVPGMLLVTLRAGELGTHHPLQSILGDSQISDRCRELRMSPLSEPAIARYVDVRLSPHDLPPGAARLIHERTNGNPMFMVKLVDSWIDKQLIEQDAGRWRLRVDPGELTRTVPDSASRMIEKEIERLTRRDRDILEAASVAGLDFSVATVAVALGVDALEVEGACRAWSQRGTFLRPMEDGAHPAGGFSSRAVFIHGLYQQVIYERIGTSRLVQIHRAIGEHLASAHGHHGGVAAAELAMHFERAREYARAAPFFATAGVGALRRSANREAIDLFDQGLAALQRCPEDARRAIVELELQVGLGAALAMTRGYAAPEVDRAYVRARQLCDELGDVVLLYPVVMEGIWKFYYSRGDFRTANALAEQCERLAQEPRAEVRLSREARLMLGVSRFYGGRLLESRQHLEQVLLLVEVDTSSADLPPYKEDSGVSAFAHLGWTLWMLGHPDLALHRARQAVARARDLSHPFTLAFALYFALVVYHFRRDYAEGLDVADELSTLTSEQGFVFFAALGNMVRGAIVATSGDPSSGLASFEAGWAVYRQIGAGTGGPFFIATLAETLARAGRVDEALERLTEALRLAEESHDHGWDPEIHRLRGELAPQRAEACFSTALETARKAQALGLELRAGLSLARLWLSQGHTARATDLVSDILGKFQEGLDTADLLEARRLLASV